MQFHMKLDQNCFRSNVFSNVFIRLAIGSYVFIRKPLWVQTGLTQCSCGKVIVHCLCWVCMLLHIPIHIYIYICIYTYIKRELYICMQVAIYVWGVCIHTVGSWGAFESAAGSWHVWRELGEESCMPMLPGEHTNIQTFSLSSAHRYAYRPLQRFWMACHLCSPICIFKTTIWVYQRLIWHSQRLIWVWCMHIQTFIIFRYEGARGC